MVQKRYCGYGTKTANSGYLTRRLIDVGQDILIREKTV
jgi:DNA-directed RNA polymerase beta' subunit